MITVKELIAELQQCDPDDVVILSIDEEGNGYSPLYQITPNYNYDESYGEIGYRSLTPEQIQHGYTEADVKEGLPCVVLWP